MSLLLWFTSVPRSNRDCTTSENPQKLAAIARYFVRNYKAIASYAYPLLMRANKFRAANWFVWSHLEYILCRDLFCTYISTYQCRAGHCLNFVMTDLPPSLQSQLKTFQPTERDHGVYEIHLLLHLVLPTLLSPFNAKAEMEGVCPFMLLSL